MTRDTMVSILKDLYQEDIPDSKLYEEAIETIENYLFTLLPEVLYHKSRVIVIAYIALIAERNNKHD